VIVSNITEGAKRNVESIQIAIEPDSLYPQTYLYLDRFKRILENRTGYLKYLKNEPSYSLYDIKKYTFAPYKVVWTRIAKIEAAVISTLEGKSIIPQETITVVPLDNEKEAYYIAGLINSTVFQYATISYSQAGGKSMGSMHVLQNIRIPKFDSKNNLHLRLAELSEQAREFTSQGKQDEVKRIEKEIDELAGQIWGLTREELKEIKNSLEELSK